MFMIMMGFTFFSASMSAGGQLGIGLNMTKFICALLIGNAILGVYTGILGYIGCKTGLTLDLMARHAFGKKDPGFVLQLLLLHRWDGLA